ncbi:MAG: diguanylate cyclase [Phycisphaerae bacterium]|nr:diguanylate cyclase [Phycisphaerae bacterium]
MDICVIENRGEDRRALVDQLVAADYQVAQAGNGEEGLQLVLSTRPKVVLCASNLPGLNGLQICKRVRGADKRCDPYFVLLADTHDIQDKAESLETGADDYLARPYAIRELLARVAVGMRIGTLQENLRQAAVTDGLTGLWTHQHFIAVLETEFARSRRYGGHLSVVMSDLDDFKVINDAFGHQAGNAVLMQVADALRSAVRHLDIPARYGGEEFAIVVPEVDLPETRQMAERLRSLIQETVRIDGHEDYDVTLSVGIASANDERIVTPEDLIELADRALYLAKRRGRNRVCTSEDVTRNPELADTVRDAEIRDLHKRVASLSLRSRESYVQGIWALVQALEARDPNTANHSRNVATYAEAIADEMAMSESLKRVVRNAAMLHDIGKIGVPDRILLKQSPLTPEEREVLLRVPLISAHIIDHMRILDSEVVMIRHQHEHFDGTGHPSGLRGQEIPLGSRILLVAEAFDAITTDRAYRLGRDLEAGLAELKTNAGTQLDPMVVTAFHAAARKHAATWQDRIDTSLPQTPSHTLLQVE